MNVKATRIKKQVNVENQAIFIADDMLIVGCDIGSETHYIRAIDVRGRELSSGAFEFSNTSEGFANAKACLLYTSPSPRDTR